MATSPRAKLDRDEKFALYDISDKAFGEKLQLLQKQHDTILRLNSKVYALPSGTALEVSGRHVTRGDVKNLSKQFKVELKSLKNNYIWHGKRKPRKGGNSSGLQKPILVTENFKNFFKEANLGPAAISLTADNQIVATDPTPLNNYLSVQDTGRTSRAILTSLLSIYAQINNMQQDPTNGQILTATPEMNKWLSDTYVRLAAKPQKYSKMVNEFGEKVPDLSKPIPKFSPERFRFSEFQSIMSDNTIKNLTPEQQAMLDDPTIKERLVGEQEMVTALGAIYRKKRETDKRRAKQAAK
jgi:hypothetical protein